MNELKKIIIKNYRSVKELEIIVPSNEHISSNCFGLVGINEAGKSSVLKAIALKDNLTTLEIKINDFNNYDNPISIEYYYELGLTNDDIREVIGESFSDKTVKNLKKFSALYTIENNALNKINEKIQFDENEINKSTDTSLLEDLKSLYKKYIHSTVFWSADEKHLINKPINLNTFINNPESTSVPLYNCFRLAEIKNIQNAISKALSDPAERDHLEDTLGKAVTSHVKGTWKNELIEIKLKINENNLNFLIKDLDSLSKSKTVDQRSDGFKQFISFLLTISAESRKDNLVNSILLIDEPETHLHPMAQGDLLNELWEISKLEMNNYIFFATHSNYLISKNNLSNYFHVTKEGDNTSIQQFNIKQSYYSEVNYLVFNIISTDYHNALYGKLLSEIEGDTKSLDQFLKEQLKKGYVEKEYIKQNNDGSICSPSKVSLQTYIRHLIHHPENTQNLKFTDKELEDSIICIKNILANF